MTEPRSIHVARQTVQLGVFSSEEILAGLASGRFTRLDLGWTNGMAAWKPLGEWPEFTGVLPAIPVPGADEPSVASTIPWEQGKSLGSFFATFKSSILSPWATLPTGRFAFGDWVAYCYLALALSLPCQLFALFAFGSKNQQLAEMLRRFGLGEVADKMATTPDPTLWVTVFGMVIGTALAPLIYALVGIAQWLGMKLFRMPGTIERTVSATLLATALLIVLGAPFQLLGFNLLLQTIGFVLLLIPACFIYYRALGAATGTGALAQFGISMLVSFTVCFCCCFLPFFLTYTMGVSAR